MLMSVRTMKKSSVDFDSINFDIDSSSYQNIDF